MSFVIVSAITVLIFSLWCYSPRARKYRFDFLSLIFICISAISLAYSVICVIKGESFWAFGVPDIIFTAVSVTCGTVTWLLFKKIDERKK